MPVISVFGSALAKEGSFEYDSGELLGKLLADKGIGVASGGYTGIMEAVLKGASKRNVRRIGITTDFYPDKSKNEYVAEEIRTKSYYDRFIALIESGDGYVVLPGGTGTLAEFASIWALKSRGIIGNKPLVCIGEQWNEVIQTMAFYSETVVNNLSFVKIVDSAQDAVDFIEERFNEESVA
jgi:uncharacterized protein (TIGR00730 family)